MLNHLRFCAFVFFLFCTLKCTNSTIQFSTARNCCNLDVSNGKRFRRRSTSSPSVIFDEGLNGMKWNKKSITYRVSAYSAKLTKIYVDTEIEKAFKLWSAHADLEFFKISINASEEVDIDIRFCQGNHGDATPFRNFDIAHAFAPEEELGGDIHFNENFTHWHDGTTFLHTATHEIGHALGLYHIPLQYAVMSPYQGHAGFNVQLSLEDIQNIQALYGKKPSSFPPPPIFDTTTVMTTQIDKRKITTKETAKRPTSERPKTPIFKEVFEPVEDRPPTGESGQLQKFANVSTTPLPPVTTSTTTLATTRTTPRITAPTSTTTTVSATFHPTVAVTTGEPNVKLWLDLDVEGSGGDEISDAESEEEIMVFVKPVTTKISHSPEEGVSVTDLGNTMAVTDITLDEEGEHGDGVINGNNNLKNSISALKETSLIITIPICICFADLLIRIN